MRKEKNEMNMMLGIFPHVEEIGGVIIMSANGESFANTEHVLWNQEQRDYIRDTEGNVLVFTNYHEAFAFATNHQQYEDNNLTREVEYSSYE